MPPDDIVHELRGLMKTVATETVDWDSVAEQDRLDAIGIDSLGFLDLVYDIQQHFGVQFELEELARLETVAELVALIRERRT